MNDSCPPVEANTNARLGAARPATGMLDSAPVTAFGQTPPTPQPRFCASSWQLLCPVADVMLIPTLWSCPGAAASVCMEHGVVARASSETHIGTPIPTAATAKTARDAIHRMESG